ncbi:MAG TPA: hypothetical protein VIH14_00380 [Anaerolineales bacterium]
MGTGGNVAVGGGKVWIWVGKTVVEVGKGKVAVCVRTWVAVGLGVFFASVDVAEPALLGNDRRAVFA